MFQILNTIYSKTPDKLNFRYTELTQQIILEYEKMFNDNLGDNNAKKLLTKFIDNGWILKSGDKGFLNTF